jgi:hypothetical protein
VTSENIWARVTSEDEARRAEELVASAIGAELAPEVLVEELRRTMDRLVSGTHEEIAENVLSHVAALVGVIRGSLANTAALLADVQGLDTQDAAVTRPIEIRMLDAAVQSFVVALGGASP